MDIALSRNLEKSLKNASKEVGRIGQRLLDCSRIDPIIRDTTKKRRPKTRLTRSMGQVSYLLHKGGILPDLFYLMENVLYSKNSDIARNCLITHFFKSFQTEALFLYPKKNGLENDLFGIL